MMVDPGLAAQRERYLARYPPFRWEIPNTYSIADDALFRHAATKPAAYSVDDRDRLTMVSFGYVQDGARRFAGALQALGVRRGDRVAVALPPSVDAAIAIFGILALGAVVLGIPQIAGPGALAYRVEHAEARVLITDGDTLARCVDAGVTLHDVTVIRQGTGGRMSLERLIGDAQPLAPTLLRAQSPALLFYTSGTSGNPKGVLHAHRMLLGHAGVDAAFDRFRASDVYYGTAEWGWIGGMLLGLCIPWAFGVPIVAWRPKHFDPERLIRLWNAIQVSVAFLPPAAIRALRAAGAKPARPLRAVVTGGELPTAADRAAVLDGIARACHNAYGQTEANALIGESDVIGDATVGSLGRPFPGHSINIRDDEGLSLAPGAVGEICVDLPDPVALLAYWGDDTRTQALIGRGYLRTGDLARMESDGGLSYQGRTDDLIKVRGYRIGPAEIESALTSDASVHEAVAIGVRDEVHGDCIKAYLRLHDQSVPADLFERLREAVRRTVGPHAVPRDFEVLAELPRGATGKVQRALLRDHARA